MNLRVGRYRWVICALLFAATTINYMDRQVLGLLAPTLQKELGWTEVDYGNIVSWFTIAYAMGLLGVGRLMDKIGVKKGFAGSIIVWSAAAVGHAFASTAQGFSAARFMLGLGEAGNFPGSLKAVSEWFPVKERGFATGIFNAGSNVGAILTPIIVPAIALTWGWRAAFVIVGSLGFVWLIVWLLVYQAPEKNPRVSAQELAYIRSDNEESSGERVSLMQMLGQRQLWAFALGKLLTDPIWWFYLYWLPKFLDARFGIKLAGVALPIIVIYLVADVGSVGGGWLSGRLIKAGWTTNRARKITMLIAALAIVPTMFAPTVSTLWSAVAIVSVAAAAHQWWSANLFTLATDMYPRRAVGTVIGFGGCFGALGGFFFQRATGWVLQNNGQNYTPVFLVCGLAYVTALIVIHLLVPRLTPARLGTGAAA